MRILMLLIALAGVQPAMASEELDPEWLAALAMHLTPDFDYRAFAEHRIRVDDRRGWREIASHPGAAEAAIENLEARWRERAASVNPDQVLRVSAPIRFQTPVEDGLAVLNWPLKPVHGVANPVAAPGLPDGFTLLVANADLIPVWPMSQEQAKAFLAEWVDRPRLRRVAWLDFEFRLYDYLQQANFHAVVSRATLYDDSDRKNVLYQVTEPRPPAQVVAESLLSEGLTFRVAPIHSFAVLGIRLLEPLREPELANATCRDLPRIGDHRVLDCIQPWPLPGVELSVRRRYYGGTLVGVDGILRAPAEGRGRTALLGQLRRAIDLPSPVPEKAPACWVHESVAMRYDPEALNAADGQRPFLITRPRAWEPGVAEAGCPGT